MSKERFEIDCTGGILDLKDIDNMYCLNDSEICELLNKQDKQISDLETKLAESEEKCKKAYQEGLFQKQFDKDMEIEQLKQQLADKEKEIEKLKAVVDMIDKYRQYDKDAENLVLLNPENCYSNGHKLIIKTDNQDKIDFAVEQLEQFEEVFSNKIDIICENHKWDFNTRIALQTALNNVKNNQINRIKEGSK